MNTVFLQVVKDRKLAHDLRQIADDFEILDFFRQYGSSCFAMSALLTEVLAEKGYSARVQGCYAAIKQNNSVFYVGYKGFAHDRQREGHAVCIVEDQYLLDFGLGTLKKFYAEDFSHALACEVTGNGKILGALDLETGANIAWWVDWISPAIEQELIAQQAGVEALLGLYNDFQKNRMSYLIKKMFVNNPGIHHDRPDALSKTIAKERVADKNNLPELLVQAI